MSGTFEATIAELKTRRDKIDSAIAALEELGGEAPKPERQSQSAKAVKAKAPKGAVVISKSRKVDSGGSSVQDLVVGVLKSGPKRPGAVLKALKGKATEGSIYTMLSYLKSKGITTVTAEREHKLA